MVGLGVAMRWKELTRGREGRTLALIFESGDDVMELLEDFARDQDVTTAQITAIGAFQRAELGYFDWGERDYVRIPVDEQVEVLSLAGDIARSDGGPALHLHAVLGRRDGTTRGGHLLEAVARPTLEMILREPAAELRKRHDPESGLALIDPAI
jgi:uncharacterized protein